MIQTIAELWGAWVVLNLLVMLWISYVRQPDVCCFTGFVIVIPQSVRERLDAKEIAGIQAHEEGHRHHGHPWINFARLCIFCPMSRMGRIDQELQADDFAASKGHALGLASALQKLSCSGIDYSRSLRLIRAYL